MATTTVVALVVAVKAVVAKVAHVVAAQKWPQKKNNLTSA
jgi:hypothetical protein